MTWVCLLSEVLTEVSGINGSDYRICTRGGATGVGWSENLDFLFPLFLILIINYFSFGKLGVFCEFEVNLGRIGREFRVFGEGERVGPKKRGVDVAGKP
nr:hypothetical protein Iba_chr04dCG2330 [Ipomoea batatas]